MTQSTTPQAMPDELYVTTAAGLVEGAYRDRETLRRDWQRMWPEYTETELDAIMTAPEEQSEIYHVRQVRETRNGAIYQSRQGNFYRVYNDWDKYGAASGGIVRPDELATAGNAFFLWYTEHTESDCQNELDRVRIADELAIPMAYDNGVHLTNQGHVLPTSCRCRAWPSTMLQCSGAASHAYKRKWPALMLPRMRGGPCRKSRLRGHRTAGSYCHDRLFTAGDMNRLREVQAIPSLVPAGCTQDSSCSLFTLRMVTCCQKIQNFFVMFSKLAFLLAIEN